MRLVIESTDQVAAGGDLALRLWKGLHEESGARCWVWVALVAVPEGEDASAFDQALLPLPAAAAPPGGPAHGRR